MHYFKDTWNVLDSYFHTNPYFLTKHHLDSWNDFVANKIQGTIKVLNPFIILKNQDNGIITHEIKVYVGGRTGDKLYINKPVIHENGMARVLFPNEARLRDLTYQSEIFADITVNIVTIDKSNGAERTTSVDQEFQSIKLGAIPIMLHSKLCCLHNQTFESLKEMGECPYDQGGYFIIDGKEKVIVAQERIALNKIFTSVSKVPEYSYEALVRSTSEDNPLFPKTVNVYVNAKNRKVDKKKDLRRIRPDSIVLSCPNITTLVPVWILFRALGVESDKEIIEHILGDTNDPRNHEAIDFLRASILCANDITTQEDALEFLKGFVKYNEIDKVRYVLVHDLFPNVGNSFHKKAMFLGHVIKKLVYTALGICTTSDRDSYIYKRVDISGFLIGNLFRDYYNQFRNTVRSLIDREYLLGPWRTTKNIEHLVNKGNLTYIFRPYIIEDGMKKSLKGSWGKSMIATVQDEDAVKEGLVQDLSRISYLSYMSHIRRVSTPIDPTSKIVAPHRLHPSQWGVMCPIESPDGGSIGLLKHFAILCNVTFESGTAPVIAWLKGLGVHMLDEVPTLFANSATKILINSNWVGVYENAPLLYQVLKLLKTNGYFDKYVSISWDIIAAEINISTEAGRCCRPVYVVDKNGRLLIEDYISDVKQGILQWRDLIEGKRSLDITPDTILEMYPDLQKLVSQLALTQVPIEYLDVEETNVSMISMDSSCLKQTQTQVITRYTHCEIHPSVVLGAVGQNIPMLNHNQAPRNIFFCAQGKQAVGAFASSFNRRIDTMAYVLSYPQRQLVTTRYKQYMYNNVLTGGENLIVAVATWTGYNQEDSIIINRSAIQRGCFNMTYFKNIIDKESENKMEHERIIFANPLTAVQEGQEVNNIKFAKYKDTLDKNGFPVLNKYISENDAIIGKTMIKTEYTESSTQDSVFTSQVAKEVVYDKSIIADKTVSGIVDKVVIYNDTEGNRTCKVRLRKTRIPEFGDKMAAVHGQKGVVGMILSDVDMPFSADGITPDIIINPHAFPSRMTIGQLLECVLAKTCVMEGCMVDATPFNNNDYSSIYSLLETKYGMDKHGNEMLYNGRTGDQIQTEIFIGPTYYQRLKHMVGDKMNYRTTGPRTMTTRQPTQGRGNGGGLRIGEMERDSILSHGLSGFLKESLMERSDKYTFNVDTASGMIAIANKKEGIFVPQAEVNNTFYSSITTPYAFKLMVQEVLAMGVKPILMTSEDHEAYMEDEEFYEDNELLDEELDNEHDDPHEL